MARTNGKGQQWASVIKGLYEKRGWFYYQPPTPKGAPPGTPRPKAVALKTQVLSEAVEKVEQHRHDIVLKQRQQQGTMEELLPAYHLAKAGDVKVTRLFREQVLKGFMDMTGNPRVSQIDRPMIEAWRKRLVEKGGNRGWPLSASSLESYAIALRAFLNWAKEQGYVESNPVSGMKIRVGATRVQDFLTEDERERLLAARASEHVRLILHLGFFAGLRDGEMLALNPQWIWLSDDKTRGTITVQNTPIIFTDGKRGMWKPKTRKMRTIPMHPRLLEFLLAYGIREPWMLAPEKVRWPGEHVHTTRRFDARGGLRLVAVRAGVRKLSPHMLRHSFATHLAMKGVALAEIAGLLGDTLSVTEAHYAGYQPGKGNPLDVL